MKTALRWITFVAGVVPVAVSTFGSAVPVWLLGAGAFLSGLATNAERLFGGKGDGN